MQYEQKKNINVKSVLDQGVNQIIIFTKEFMIEQQLFICIEIFFFIN